MKRNIPLDSGSIAPADLAGSAISCVRLPSRLRRGSAFAALCLALLPVAHAVESIKTVTPLHDTWVASGSGSNGTSTVLTTTNASGAVKEIYLKFKVTIGGANGIGTGTPVKAELVLAKTAGPSGAQILAFAANNRADSASADWVESVTWSAKPKFITPPINSVNSAASGAETITIDVTPYISGAGVFSFCVKTWSSADISFSSKEGANDPELRITIDDQRDSAYFTRTVAAVAARGDTYITRYGASTTGGAAGDVDNYGYFDVTKQPYGARTSGITTAADAELNTLAIQRALNEARDARVALYFPGGGYIVNDTLHAVQGIIDYSFFEGERWNQRDFGCVLLGATSGTRAKLVLRDSSTGFNSTGTPKPLLYLWARNNKDGGNPNNHQQNINYNQVVRDLDIEIQANNAGAVGVFHPSAQGSSLHDMTISSTGGAAYYAGIFGATGPGGGIYGVTVLGGDYGLRVTSGNGETSTVANCTFKNQTTNSIYWNSLSALTVVGTWIEGKGAYFASGGAWSGCLSMVDCVLQLSSTSSPAFAGTRNLYLNNVYIANTNTVAQITNLPTVSGNASGWVHVKEYAGGVYVDQSPDWNQAVRGGTDGQSWVPSFIGPNGATAPTRYTYASGQPAPLLSITNPYTGRVPTELDLDSWHATPALPSWEGSTGATSVVNAKLVAGRPLAADNVTDDHTNLQWIIDNHPRVFIPRGQYRISQPLVLRADSVVFGINKNFVRIKPLAGASAFGNASAPNPLVDTPSNANATTLLAEVMLSQTMDRVGAYSLRWRAGGGSGVRDINYERRQTNAATQHDMDFSLLRIEGNGGGRWFNLWTDNTSYQVPGYRHVTINGTSQPLSIYMFNPEDDDTDVQVEITSARNFSIYGVKAEGKKAVFDTYMKFTNSQNFRVVGFGGNAQSSADIPANALLLVDNCKDFLFATQSFQQVSPGGDEPIDPWDYRIVRDVTSNSTTPGYEQFVLYKRGNPGLFGPFIAEDIGSPALAGTTTWDNGVFTIDAGGADIFGTSDEFRFVHQEWSGDAQLIARVGAVEMTHGWAKAGLMLRETTAAGAKNVMLAVTPSNGVQMHHRDTGGGLSTSDQVVGSIAAPYFLRLERRGSVYTGWHSPDGEIWFRTDATSFGMSTVFRAGLAVTSHNTGSLNTSTLNRVSLAAPPVFSTMDVGSVGATGSSTVDYALDEHTLNGAGTAIGGTADSFRFTYLPWNGDGTIVAEVVSVENTHSNAKAAIMIRNATTAGAAHATVALTPGNQVQFIRRTGDGAGTTTSQAAVTAGARFLKLVKAGSTFTAYYLNDSGAWISLGSATITMDNANVIGLASCSIVNTSNLCTAVFNSVYVK